MPINRQQMGKKEAERRKKADRHKEADRQKEEADRQTDMTSEDPKNPDINITTFR